MKLLLTLFLSFALGYSAQSQQTEVVSFEDLRLDIEKVSPNIKIYNFWATFCRPCVAEMPHFEKVNSIEDDVDVTFISLDFVENLETKVNPFLEKKNIESRSLLLDDIDYNSWIDQVSPEWSGAIPATLLVSKDAKIFHEGEMSEELLMKYISSIKDKK